jgi:hypothetical protein
MAPASRDCSASETLMSDVALAADPASAMKTMTIAPIAMRWSNEKVEREPRNMTCLLELDAPLCGV